MIGDSAPRWLDFVTTRVDADRFVHLERLGDCDALTEWLASHGLQPEAAVTPADLAAARHVRNGLRELALARANGRTPHPQAIDTVNAVIARAARAPRHIVVPDPIEPGRLRRRVSDVDAALALVVEEAIDVLAGHDAVFLRACEEPSCAEIFFDPTGRRRWCSSQTCGTRARVRAHRARRKAAYAGQA